MTSGTYWNYERDEINDDANENNANNIKTKKKIKQQQVNLLNIRQK